MKIEARTSEVIRLRGRNMAASGSSRRSMENLLQQERDALHVLGYHGGEWWKDGDTSCGLKPRQPSLERQGTAKGAFPTLGMDDKLSAHLLPLRDPKGDIESSLCRYGKVYRRQAKHDCY